MYRKHIRSASVALADPLVKHLNCWLVCIMQVLDIVISQPASRLEGLLKLSVGMVLSARG